MRNSNANLIFLFLLSFPKSKHTEFHPRETWKTNLSQVFLDFVQFSKHLMGIGVRPETNLRKEKPPFPATFWILNSMQAGARKLRKCCKSAIALCANSKKGLIRQIAHLTLLPSIRWVLTQYRQVTTRNAKCWPNTTKYNCTVFPLAIVKVAKVRYIFCFAHQFIPAQKSVVNFR